ncbi:MAG: type I-D CRISPR-associated protein Cas10d/Csc3 [Synechococcales cyanobacterium RM1_1_8]|nr:type I-D CRISPR-associated protein Cas10d/Csc3 [Synechococcales cyanobacterium RM1_1_8]
MTVKSMTSEDTWGFGDEDLGLDQESDRTLTKPEELLTLKLLKQAVQSENADDPVMADFAEHVLPNLLKYAVGVTAKGGKFFDRIDEQRKVEGQPPVRRDNAGDQSLNTHLLNGLFPANLIEKRLAAMNTTVRREVKELERRLAIAGFVLHDFEKFDYRLFEQMPEHFQRINQTHDLSQGIRDLSVDEHRELFCLLVPALGIDQLVSPDQPSQWQIYLDDLLFIAYNAQRRSDTNLNLSEDSLRPELRDRKLRVLADLTCLADRLASIIKHPQDAMNKGLNELLHGLSDGQLKFSYHAIAENRGVLTNVLNNALMKAHTSLNTETETYHQPLLYLPTGVIYLSSRDAPSIDLATLPNQVVASIKSLCAGELQKRQTGFGRDGKGMKYADYYNLFFEDTALMQVALDATLRILNPGKNSVARSRSDNLIKFQELGVLPADYDFNFEDDIRIDQLAEFGDVISRKIWGDRVNRIEQLRKNYAQAHKKNKQPDVPKTLPEIEDRLQPGQLIHRVAEFLGLADYSPQLREIQRINESLKANKLKGNTGGVPYEWYFLAARYIQGSGLEDIRAVGQSLIDFLKGQLEPIADTYVLEDGWNDLRDWVGRVVMLPDAPEMPPESASAQVDIFLQELASYNAAKKPGRGRQLICSISHSPYSVTEQMESAVLFTPQVYTNKQHLGGSNAKRNISSIAGLEMMLRQILMNQSQAVGKRFEDGKYRYLYFYPTYYFTPETNQFLKRAYSKIAQTRYDASLRKHFVSGFEAKFHQGQYQSADAFLIADDLERRKQLDEKDDDFVRDRTFKLSYPDDQPLTFYFMALPPGRDSTDTESWVLPAWLALAFPMILDVKTVVSESPIPPFNDGAEFEETVFLDSAPQAIRTLVKRERFRLDYILEGWSENGEHYPSPLKALTAAYSIHLDVNPKQGKGGYDANWGKLTELAKDFETSPLHVFSYLARWVRGQKNVDTASPQRIRLYAHHFYPCFDAGATYDFTTEQWHLKPNSPMNHPKTLTELYRRFYRAEQRYNPKANAVLKPIDIAAETVLKAETSVFSGETLVAAVAAEICKLMDRVHASTAQGRWMFNGKQRDQERQAVLEFSRFFVTNVFEEAFAGDRARLAGKQINLIKNTCEFLYRLEDDKENQQYKTEKEAAEAKASA